MKKQKYVRPETEIIRFQHLDGQLYTLSGGQNGNETGGGIDPFGMNPFNETEF